ncbi:class I SAM-dependent methyltransferase [Ramlibacter algicola]|uniref:Class I SAM-dependent methyltransferase n=1 Tax=Ramlibacter algicola TaxID=2795217 RepID=A0A934Q2U0_9BURK|nr:class I SAM-dependent methyltransferase [Ramlibacter algicola]MBK0393783.1 class I SAM-dependent methyltransferase [Ramlibacter algicola]
MEQQSAIAGHWAKGDVYAQVIATLEKMGKPLRGLTVEDLAPVDHFHARGFPATVDLADRLTIDAGDQVLDIGCGIGGPARYIATRFGCHVTGIDLTPTFVAAGRKLTALLELEDRVAMEEGDAQHLPYADGRFDGALAQHVTMNIPDRSRFFAEAARVLKPGAFFALTEHGLGPAGTPHYPLPWSEDGSGAYLVTPAETRSLLQQAGFEDVEVEDTGDKYLAAYKKVMALAEQDLLPPLGVHILLGANARDKTRNAARNIEEGRTHPIQVICRKRA